MHRLNIYILWTIGLLLFAGCEAPYPYYPDNKQKIVIVEGLLTNEFKYQRIRLSYSVSTTSDTVEPVTGATVCVETKNRRFYFVSSDSLPGVYVSRRKFAVTIDRMYRLTVSVGDNIYTAYTSAVPVRLMDSIKWEYIADTGLYRLTYVAPVFDPFHSAMYILYLDWSSVPGYENKPFDSTHAKMYFFTLRSMDVNELFQPYQEQVYFPRGTVIMEKKYSLTPFFETYIRALLLETHWSGSLFDVEHCNLPTNISGGALGYFTASSVIKKKYVVE